MCTCVHCTSRVGNVYAAEASHVPGLGAPVRLFYSDSSQGRGPKGELR